ncbi:phosphoglycolate phosphatase [Achromobacter sp. DH1f]|uniref:phosphoglycolate phosphatase n=1 Tax=Achromobacter sp. DH1f TaxID=1397275 RepID=UPI0004689356|nr:phosphoglycolate phosphatase [Achromobacter sp. DH1f]
MTTYTALQDATIAFDLDGTLVESAPDLVGAINAVLQAAGYPAVTYPQAKAHVSRGAKWMIQWALTQAGEPEPEARSADLFPQFVDRYREHIADESRPFPGVVDAIQQLKAAGAKLVVCTNKPTALSVRLLTLLDMAPLFDGVVGLDAVTAPKPDPAHLIEAVQAVGGDVSRTVMVGDAAPDAGAARGAGTPLILVSFGYTEIPAADLKPDVLLHHFDDLVDACVRLLNPQA